MDSDEPWQTLACCMEIAKAMRSPDPKRYMSHFPIHQDGSCNGLQHYAALGRDSAGAFSVNLTASRVPQDVYSAVAVLVERQRRNDAEKGVQVGEIAATYWYEFDTAVFFTDRSGPGWFREEEGYQTDGYDHGVWRH